jgi:hypothetical protein
MYVGRQVYYRDKFPPVYSVQPLHECPSTLSIVQCTQLTGVARNNNGMLSDHKVGLDGLGQKC